MRTLLVVVAAGLSLAACVPSTPSVFKDPKTGQVQQCTSSTGGGFFPIINGLAAQSEIQSCSDAYRRMGWVQQ